MNEVEVVTVEGAEARKVFDSICEYYLGIPGEEFLTKWREGSITHEDGENDSRVHRVISALPFAHEQDEGS